MLKLLKTVIPTLWISLALALTACGGAGGDKNNGPKKSASPSLSFKQIKIFAFSWSDVSDATHYKLLENADGKSGFNQVGSDIPQGDENFDHYVPLHKRVNAQYILQSCNTDGCTDSDTISVTGNLVESIGYVKASVKGRKLVLSSGALNEFDEFGTNVALSDDGKTMAVGAPGEGSNAVGINGDELDDSAFNSGAVYIFNKGSNNIWVQQAYIKASEIQNSEMFGAVIALSGDGETLVVGNDTFNTNRLEIFTLDRISTLWELIHKLVLNGVPETLSLSNNGEVLVVALEGETSVDVYTIDSSNVNLKTTVVVHGNEVLSLSGDGDSLAIIGSISHGGVNINIYTPNSLGNWTLTDHLIPDEESSIRAVFSLSFSDEGNTLVAGRAGSGGTRESVVIFDKNSLGQWSQQELNKENIADGETFGFPVFISGDGNTLAVGANTNGSNAKGIGGGNSDNSNNLSGAVYMYSRVNDEWQQTAFVKASNSKGDERFGSPSTIGLSADGNTLAVGVPSESSSSTGISNGDQENNGAIRSGAVYLY